MLGRTVHHRLVAQRSYLSACPEMRDMWTFGSGRDINNEIIGEILGLQLAAMSKRRRC